MSVVGVRDELRAVVTALDPEVLSVASAQQLVAHFADIERLAAAGKALAARRVAAGAGWRHRGHRTPAEWLAHTTGTTTSAAAATLSAATRLHHLPDVDTAVRNGDLSPAQTVAVTAAATAHPAAQADLVAAARTDTLAQLQERCARIRATATDHQARHAHLHRTRHLRTWSDPDGAARITIRTTPEHGAELTAALTPHLRAVLHDAHHSGQRDASDAYAHDALFHLIRSHHTTTPADDHEAPAGPEPTGPEPTSAGGGHAGSGGTTGALRPTVPPGAGHGPGVTTGPDTPVARRPVGPRAKVVVVVDHTAFTRGHTRPGETCEIPGVGPIPVTVARALAADAFLAAVIRRGTDIVNVAHLGRAVTAEQRTALELRDPTCVIPGCDTRTHLEIDHTTSATGWADTRRTTLHELARLCPHHHHQKTYDGYQLHGPPGHWQWHPPPHPHHP